MCVYSLVVDHFTDKWRPYVPAWPPEGTGGNGIGVPPNITIGITSPLTQAEIDQFRRDVAEFKILLERAREYDRRNNEPECESDEKLTILKKIAAALDIDLTEVLKV